MAKGEREEREQNQTQAFQLGYVLLTFEWINFFFNFLKVFWYFWIGEKIFKKYKKSKFWQKYEKKI